MKVNVPAGKYVLAVSGGLDSMVLLNILAKSQKPKAKSQFVVAHFNHGIRADSAKDEALVRKKAKEYNLPFEFGHGNLGACTSEEKARDARYKFLREAKKKHNAKAIITAHHQDDLIETTIINIFRGTGRHGVTAMAQNPDVARPLLNFSKKDLLKYAKGHNLQWREDETNQDMSYLRNYIRARLTPKLSDKKRARLMADINKLQALNPLLDQEIATLSQSIEENDQINRQKFINLPPEIAAEVVIYILRQKGIRQIDKKLIERLALAIKTAKAGTKHDIMKGVTMKISQSFATISEK